MLFKCNVLQCFAFVAKSISNVTVVVVVFFFCVYLGGIKIHLPGANTLDLLVGLVVRY